MTIESLDVISKTSQISRRLFQTQFLFGIKTQTPCKDWVAAPVKKGSLVLIHGQVLHKSEANHSSNPRHAYTFHMIETK